MHQEWLIESFLEPVFADWLEAAIMQNVFPPTIAISRFDALNRPFFTGRSYPWIDPDKDASAKLKELRSGQTSLLRYHAEQGDDTEELFAEIARVNELAAKYGIKLQFEDAARETQSDPNVDPGADPNAPAEPAPTNGKAGKKAMDSLIAGR
jgi:capsid protein